MKLLTVLQEVNQGLPLDPRLLPTVHKAFLILLIFLQFEWAPADCFKLFSSSEEPAERDKKDNLATSTFHWISFIPAHLHISQETLFQLWHWSFGLIMRKAHYQWCTVKINSNHVNTFKLLSHNLISYFYCHYHITGILFYFFTQWHVFFFLLELIKTNFQRL